MLMKKHVEKAHVEKEPDAPPKHEDPKDKRIRRLTEMLTEIKETYVQGNVNHVKAIESVLAEQ